MVDTTRALSTGIGVPIVIARLPVALGDAVTLLDLHGAIVDGG